jgi:hypothetical protein
MNVTTHGNSGINGRAGERPGAGDCGASDYRECQARSALSFDRMVAAVSVRIVDGATGCTAP